MTERPEPTEIHGTAIEMNAETIGWLAPDLSALKRGAAIHAITAACDLYDRLQQAEAKIRELEEALGK